MSERRWTKRVLSGIVILLALYMALVFVLDPVMLYHAPWVWPEGAKRHLPLQQLWHCPPHGIRFRDFGREHVPLRENERL